MSEEMKTVIVKAFIKRTGFVNVVGSVDKVLSELWPEIDGHLSSCQKELAEAKNWVKDLQSGMYINCVYCGHRYGPKDKVPASMADVLKSHVEMCPKHPMSQIKKELAEAKLTITAMHCSMGTMSNEVERLRTEIAHLVRVKKNMEILP